MLARALVAALLCVVPSFVIARPLETPNGVSTIAETRRNLFAWKGKLVAMRGRIVRVEADLKGQPLFQLEVGSPPRTDRIWVASLVRFPVEPGDELLYLGMMTHTRSEAEGMRMSRFVDEKFVALGFCFLNLTQKWGGGDPALKATCDRWFKVGMPTELK